MKDHDPEKKYEWLATRVDDYITERRSKLNRANISKSIAEMNSRNALFDPMGFRTDAAPWFVAAAPGSSEATTDLGGGNNERRNAKNRTPTPAPNGRKQTKSLLCNYFQLGNCRFGNECQFSHEIPPVGSDSLK